MNDEDTGAGACKEGLSPLIEQASPAIPQYTSQPVLETKVEAAPARDSPSSASSLRGKDTLFRQVMALRDNDSPVSPETQLPEDFLSEIGDAETINIVLGETPKLPSENFAEPIPHTIHERDEDEVKFADGRNSIYPDDSVSVIFYQQQRQQAEAKIPSHLKVAERAGQFTLDNEARSQINRVLDHYQEGNVTPQMAHEFQRQVESLTPDITTHDDWQSPDATRYYLKSVLDFSNFGPPTPSTISPADVRRGSNALSVREPSKHSRAQSVDEALKDEPEFRGTAIIYTSQRYVSYHSSLSNRSKQLSVK
jgi:hypothetical protein